MAASEAYVLALLPLAPSLSFAYKECCSTGANNASAPQRTGTVTASGGSRGRPDTIAWANEYVHVPPRG